MSDQQRVREELRGAIAEASREDLEQIADVVEEGFGQRAGIYSGLVRAAVSGIRAAVGKAQGVRQAFADPLSLRTPPDTPVPPASQR